VPGIPRVSWKRFIIGLILFLAGMALLIFFGHWHPVAYFVSIAVLLTGFAIAMWGYAGIFISRFARLRNARGRRGHRRE
jgi:MFS family permease